MMRAAAIAASALMVGACSLFQPPPPAVEEITEAAEAPKPAPAPKVRRAVVPEPKTPESETLMSEFERLRRLSAADLGREQEAARLAFVQVRSDASRIQFAIALTVPGGAGYDDQRALEVLEPLVKNPAAGLHGLAFLLAAHIQEQRRLLAQLQGLQQSNQGLQQNVQALQQNVQGLQQKLDALRTLERSLTERTEPAQRKR